MNSFRFVLMAALVCVLLVPAASAQNVIIIAGDGQVICPGCVGIGTGFFQAVVVKVVDSNGNPMAGVTVNWLASSGTISTSQTVTLNDGTSSNILFTNSFSNPNVFQNFAQYTVTASAGGSTAVFYLTQGFPDAFNPSIPPLQVQAINVPVGATFTGQVGTTSSTKISVGLVDSHGVPIPNVALSLYSYQGDDPTVAPTDPTKGPVVQCAPVIPSVGTGIVLTDTTGAANCTPLFGGVPGSGHFSAVVGTSYPNGDVTQVPKGVYNSLQMNLVVTPGVAGSVKVSSGNNQSANPGQTLPAALVAEVDSSAGQPLAGVPVTWSAIPANAVNFVNKSSASDTNGKVSASVTLSGAATGTILVTVALASDPTKSAIFTITAVPVISLTGFTIVSGNNQTASVGAAFPQPLVVQVTTSSGSAANIPVQFAVTSGSVTLSSTSANTDANGNAQVNATAGSTQGAAKVTATVSGNASIGSLTFNLTVGPPPPPLGPSSFVNGADYQSNSLSPCSLGSLQGSPGSLNLNNVLPTFPGFPLSGTPVKLSIASVAAPIVGVGTNILGRDEIRFQVPCSVSPGDSVQVSLTSGGGTTTTNIPIKQASPGIFTTINSDGVYRAVVVRPDGSFVNLENPARQGESVTAFVTGLGATSPPVATPAAFNGVAVPQPANVLINPAAPSTPTGTVVVGLGAGQTAPLNFARLSEDMPGVFLVSFQIPAGAPLDNNVPFSIGLVPADGSSPLYSSTTKIPIHQ